MSRTSNLYLFLVVLSFLLMGAGVFYSFFYLPYKKQTLFEECLNESDELLKNKQQSINSEIDVLSKEMEDLEVTQERNMKEFLANNPQPSYTRPNIRSLTLETPFSKWQSQRDSIYGPVRSHYRGIEQRKEDLEKVNKEKDTWDEKCYKQFK